MLCLHINVRQATFIILSIIVNNVSITEIVAKTEDFIVSKNETFSNTTILNCSEKKACKDLPPQCFQCDFNESCTYGEKLAATCKINDTANCTGEKQFQKAYICRYCYQTEPAEHACELKPNCNSVASPRVYYLTDCTVNDTVLCLGKRTFKKNVLCNWTGGYRWTTALMLSITLGGFGADRFYLGHWQEGIGKLFSFGGLGVWTIIDVILISLHYLGPADGSLYI